MVLSISGIPLPLSTVFVISHLSAEVIPVSNSKATLRNGGNDKVSICTSLELYVYLFFDTFSSHHDLKRKMFHHLLLLSNTKRYS